MKKLLVLLSSMFIGGCSTIGYYMDAIHGHFEIMDKSKPIDIVIQEDQNSELSKKLVNFKQARKFAVRELLLPDNDSYKEYADIGRPYAVWNVIATPKLSVEPKKWCFLFAGCISYKGYFNKKDAENFAHELQEQGFDVYVAGARAYSTLGWFDDPLLNTMMYKSEAARVGILFHELAHQKIYIDDDSEFNEAFASFIQQEGVKRWFRIADKTSELNLYLVSETRKTQFNSLLKKTRTELNSLYKSKIDTQEKLLKKNNIFSDLKKEYIRLKGEWNGYDGYDKWMSQDLNNAHLALIATYNDLVPLFKSKFDTSESFAQFYTLIEDISKEDKQTRRKLLKN